MASENDVILTAWPHGRVAAEHSVVYVRSCVGSLRWSPSLRWRAVFEVPRLQKPLGCECRRGTAVRVVHSSSDTKPGAPSSAMYPGRYQLLARYFWPISYLLAISGRSETEVL